MVSYAPFGFKLNRNSVGKVRINRYLITSGYSTSLYQGDLVKFASGFVTASTTSTDICLGVFVGCEYANSTTGQPIFSNTWVASNTDTVTDQGNGIFGPIALVCDDPFAEYDVQVNGAIVAANYGKCASADYTTSGSATSGLSGMGLVASYGTGAAQFKVIGSGEHPGDLYVGSNQIVRVRFDPAFHYFTKTGGS